MGDNDTDESDYGADELLLVTLTGMAMIIEVMSYC